MQDGHLRGTHLISSNRFSVQGPCHGDTARVLIDSENPFRLLIHSLPSEPELGPFRSVTIDYLVRETEWHLKLWRRESTLQTHLSDSATNHRCNTEVPGEQRSKAASSKIASLLNTSHPDMQIFAVTQSDGSRREITPASSRLDIYIIFNSQETFPFFLQARPNRWWEKQRQETTFVRQHCPGQAKIEVLGIYICLYLPHWFYQILGIVLSKHFTHIFKNLTTMLGSGTLLFALNGWNHGDTEIK